MDIVLEVTRKCNLQCTHCLRGCAQNKTIDDYVLYRLAQEKIQSLQITGGEPTLVPNLMQRFRQAGLYPDDVWVCTNGAIYKEKWVRDFFEYRSQLDYKDIEGLSVSVDAFHPSISKENYKRYSKLAADMGEEVLEHSKYLDYHNVIPLGKGEQIGGGWCRTYECEWKGKPKTEEGYDRKIYITVDGDVIYGSNWSYKRMQYLSLGNIKEYSISYILEQAESWYRSIYSRIVKKTESELKWKRGKCDKNRNSN